MKNTAGLSRIELMVIIGVLVIIASIATASYIKYSTEPKTTEGGIAVKTEGDGATTNNENTPQNANTAQNTNSRTKIAENESPRAEQDRLFYEAYYFGSTNTITLDFTITANDADRAVNGLSIDLNAQDPALPTPTNTNISVNGGGVSNEWSCSITGTTFSCNGDAALEQNVKSTFVFTFDTLTRYPEKLTIDILENGLAVTTIIPLLQSR